MFIKHPLKTNLLCLKHKQEVQGLQTFAFSVVTVNDKQRNLGSKESVGVKFK